MKTRILRRLGLVPIKQVYNLIAAQAQERTAAQASGWDAGFIAGIETATRRDYEEAA